MHAQHYLEDAIKQFHKLKDLADRSLAQVSDQQLFFKADPQANSIAILMKHLAGNMKSRWTDFLESDGEKEWRQRDQEFLIDNGDSKESLQAAWESGWACLFDALNGITAADFDKQVTIRGEAHTITEAINRQLTHYGYHIGQLVYLARLYSGDQWTYLSVPPGKTEEHNQTMREETGRDF